MTPDLDHITGGEPYDAMHGQIYLARAKHLKQRTVRDYVRKGLMPGYFIGRRLILPKADLIAYLNGDFVPAPPPSPVEKAKQAIGLVKRIEPQRATA